MSAPGSQVRGVGNDALSKPGLAAFADDLDHRGRDRELLAGGVFEPAAAEVTHTVDDRQQGVALVSEGVLDAGRHFGETLALDDASFLEPLQTLAERLRADAAKGPLELAEAATTFGEVTQDLGGPFIADDLGCAGDWTFNRLRLFGGHGILN
jgi:hypothetical protein